MTMPLEASLSEAAEAVRSGATTSTELVGRCLDRIEETDPHVKAFASVQADDAVRRAAELDETASVGPLHGVPVALKDLFFTKGVACEANCEALEGFVPEADSTVAARMEAAGAVIVGKTNTHELAFGVSCPDSHNPWNVGRMTGGSSGGSAASLAARQVFGALGTETGASVRLPSSYCGVTGLKTTRGLVPRDGVHMLSWTYDTVGPMARTAADCRILLDVIAGYSSLDPYSVKTALSRSSEPAALRLGIPDDSFYEGIDVDAEVMATVTDAISVLTQIMAGASNVKVPNSSEHFDAGATIVFAEAAAILETTRAEANEKIGEEARETLAVGASIPGTVLAQAHDARMKVERAYLDVFDDQGVDVIIAPVTPNQVLAHGATELGGVPLIPATTQFTFPINGAGLPSLALPGGFAADGMPIGFQLIGRPFSEHTLTALGTAFQQATDYHDASPSEIM